MNPVVRVFAERASARRTSLLGIAGVVPLDFWHRRALGHEWNAHQHLAHALTADHGATKLIRRFAAARHPLETTMDDLLSIRAEAMAGMADLDIADLVERSQPLRVELHAVLSSLTPADLDQTLLRVQSPSQWSPSVSVTLHAYLDQWSIHDVEHEAAIRVAIATTPDLSAADHIRHLNPKRPRQ
jgi:hypothetical protein